MKSEKLKSFLKGVWQFCSFVFVPQRRPEHRVKATIIDENGLEKA